MKRTEIMKKNNIKSRNLEFEISVDEESNEEKQYIVEGYACKFDSETVLFETDGVEYKEKIDSRAFEEAKMDDVILNYNHTGKVVARTRNKTLFLEVRKEGLYIRADLSGTEAGKQLYNEIKGGYVDKMSIRFTIREENYDSENHMWTIYSIKRLYDVSAVDIPAYDDTTIKARKNFLLEASAQDESEREAAAEIRKRRLILKTKLLTM